MKNFTFLSLFVICNFQLSAQSDQNLYGIVRQNYFSFVYDLFDSTITYEQFDSATIRLGLANPMTGTVSNVGSNVYSETIDLTGSSLNPYDSTFIFIGSTDIKTVDLSSGFISNSVPLNNPIEESYFNNFRFNNSDSTMYGLARRNVYDSISENYIGEVFLAKTNTNTGLITQISPNSVGYGYALAGSAIDPYEMVYYFSTGSNLLGLDLYNGSVYINVSIVNPDGIAFDNFAYSCADTTIYGLIRQNYFSYVYDSTLFETIEWLDSSTVRLGKIDPNTGIVTTISPYTLNQGGYTLNGGAAVDPTTMTYYYNVGSSILGASLETGLLTSSNPFVFEEGQYFDLMRNFENCYYATPKRLEGGVLSNASFTRENDFTIYPNPSSTVLNINSNEPILSLQLISISGQTVYNENSQSKNAVIDISNLPSGLYFAKITSLKNVSTFKKFLKE